MLAVEGVTPQLQALTFSSNKKKIKSRIPIVNLSSADVSSNQESLEKMLCHDPFQDIDPNKCDLSRRVMYANPKSTSFVRCCIVRDTKGTRRFCPRYIFSFQTGEQRGIAMIAIKQAGSTRSNYHIFDLTRGPEESIQLSSRLNKKSGNYIGKLRKDEALKGKHVNSYSLFNFSCNKEIISCFMFQKQNFLPNGSRPRNFFALIPQVDEHGEVVPIKASELSNKHVICECYPSSMTVTNKEGTSIQLSMLKSRPPNIECGQYRLNFNGRVKLPSVKNMQLENEKGELFMQFGRVAADKFHLDYR